MKLFKKIKWWLWLHTMTVQKYKDYLKQEGIEESEMCYDVEINNCDGRCQGASDCPLVRCNNVSKRKMMMYEIENIKHQKWWDEVEKKLEQDEEFQKAIKNIFAEWHKDIEESENMED